ncbi:protein mono-ADP-ribosyltransferase PARP9 [Nycticebus coucang]|uniref:protein mono-ADP-ribosyltransferase PARP9 n=1 Tax=Nycticebus coucang TaxID=9470 RepID=UPI00234D4E54|nr:protein mono-ADP-ribosyltransferase PARP9 [Nycticebus coucang]XP_053420393.1 protein mono-ADP-ribosyltransferase PARP9 [Nycticebus coucang]
MDFSMGAGAAAYNEKSETDTFRENYSCQIPIKHHDFNILKNNESVLHEVLQNKFGCISTLVSPALEVTSKSLQVFRKKLTPRLELSVWKDDLTTHVVDAVVNAANENLLHGGGLAGALVKVGGIEIQEESRKFISRNGKLSVGEIAVTGSGKLPCKEIIHAVGPMWGEMDPEGCIQKLQMAITNILDYVTYTNTSIETVAIPAVSSGIFRFPLDLCTQIIVNTIRFNLYNKQMVGNLKEIHLVSNEDPTVAAFKRASELILGKNELEPWMNQEAAHPSDRMVVNNMTLQVVQGHIEWQLTEVIVNSMDPFNSRQGPVSDSIVQQAGFEMRLELNKKITSLHTTSLQNFPYVVVTKGFNLSCQYVYHVLWHSADSTHLRNAMSKCLEKCLEENITSISFPALGTGGMGIPKEIAARTMFEEVLRFAKHYSKNQLTVKFVIFPTELDLYKVFCTEITKKSKILNHIPQSTREEKRENGLEARSPVINLMSCNKEEMHEAEAWIQRILTLQDHHHIENNHILYFGEKEHDLLAQLQKTSDVSISEYTSLEKARLEIKGAQADLIEVVLSIEHMLCKVQEEVARKNEQSLWSMAGERTYQQPKRQDEMKEENVIFFQKYVVSATQEIQDQKKQFEEYGLRVIKVEKIDNEVLKAAFQRKKKMMEGRPHKNPMSHRLFHQVPYQFCNVVCRVGFQRIYSEPCDLKYGVGIYFTKNLKNLADKVKKTSATNKLIYVFEAEVLTGSFCQGQKSNIVPPPLSPGAIDIHDSVVDNVSSPETFVIFNGIQAIPRYLWTCMQDLVGLQDNSLGPMTLSQKPWGRFTDGSSVD